MRERPIIALTTDFGVGSTYVAQLKGVLLSALPAACIVDACHDLPPYDLRAAEVFLRGVAFAFPLGTVHLVVVDPGVGTARRGIAVQARGTFFVGPDNGVLGQAIAEPDSRVVVLGAPGLAREPVTSTFHGRDVFAPVAAELAGGVGLEQLGTLIRDAASSGLPRPRVEKDEIVGEVLAADRFGNLTTNIRARDVPPEWRVRAAGRDAVRARTYGEASPGILLSLAGSDGFLELSVREASAARLLGGERDIEVRCSRS